MYFKGAWYSNSLTSQLLLFFCFFLVRGEEKKKRLETLARFSWAIGMQLPEFPPPFCDVC